LLLQIVTPAPRRSRLGNRVTALRWAGLLRSLGHSVRVRTELDEAPCDVLIVLHAVRGADAVRAWSRRPHHGALILGLSGTDIYAVGASPDPEVLERAARIVALQPEALERLPEHLRPRARVILQSAPRPARSAPLPDVFEVACIAHLRAVKDPLLAAQAVRLLPQRSRVRVVHAGAALDEHLERAARNEMLRNPRWTWRGQLPRAEVLALLARARLCVQSSRNEGGANSLSEALAAGCPILATRIPGNVGVLGADHPGLVTPGDPAAMALALDRAEEDPRYLALLREHSERLAPLFAPERECTAWRELLAELACDDSLA
jgi:putative glycosyltransferase (TIGR04348 family)